MIDLLTEFQNVEARGRIVKFLNKLANTNLIVIDDFLLTSITARDTEYLYRLFDSKPPRNKTRSFIICSQLMKEEMYTRLSSFSPGLADAIMNRVASRAYDFEIQGDSMRDVNIEKELQRRKRQIICTYKNRRIFETVSLKNPMVFQIWRHGNGTDHAYNATRILENDH